MGRDTRYDTEPLGVGEKIFLWCVLLVGVFFVGYHYGKGDGFEEGKKEAEPTTQVIEAECTEVARNLYITIK